MKGNDSVNINLGHTVIILASGLSQRLGTSKQLLTYQGQSLLQIMLNRALATHPQAVVVVIPNTSSDSATVDAVTTSTTHYINKPLTKRLKTVIDEVVDRCDLTSAKVEIVENDSPESGMGHSLYLAIERLKQLQLPANYSAANHFATNKGTACFERVLIMGVDQILLDTAHLDALLAVSNEVVASRYSKCYKVLSTTTNHGIDPIAESITGLPIALSYVQLVDWQSQLSGDVGLRYLLRALPADKITKVDNLKLSLDIDTLQQQQFAIEQGWLDP